jgi:hypothetical protein
MTYGSASSFGKGGQGAPGASQYISNRSGASWSVENVTAPLFSGAHGEEPDGVPFRIFSSDLARGLLLGPAYPPLPGTGAPAGYENYYLRDNGEAGFTALLTYSDFSGLLLAPQEFELVFAGASPDLEHVVLSTCAALTVGAVEVPGGGGGCDPASPNLYEWSSRGGLQLLNLAPGGSSGTPPAHLAASAGAISDDGARVFWTDETDLFLREAGSGTVQVDQAVGGGGAFQTATPDGSVAFFTKAGHVYRYDVANEGTVDLTPAGGVQGVLGASTDGSYLYFTTASGLYLSHEGISVKIAAGADAGNSPPSTGTARVSADGARLAFVSSAKLTGFDNTDARTGEPDSEVYLYDTAGGGTLNCVSCNPRGQRPIGPSTIPGAVANGQGEGATQSYKPRILSTGGPRLFFDSVDSLTTQDSNKVEDAYEWEAGGVGSCEKAAGCVQPLSRASGSGSSFIDASADGADAFFLTADSLVPADPGSVDLYDARENGGFAEPASVIPCEEDACQPLPSPPSDPSPGTIAPGSGNPPVHFPKSGKKRHARKRHHHRHGRRLQ